MNYAFIIHSFVAITIFSILYLTINPLFRLKPFFTIIVASSLMFLNPTMTFFTISSSRNRLFISHPHYILIWVDFTVWIDILINNFSSLLLLQYEFCLFYLVRRDDLLISCHLDWNNLYVYSFFIIFCDCTILLIPF
jgi:hypothetical protein